MPVNVITNTLQPLPSTNLVAQWDFREGFGSWVFNRTGSGNYPVPLNYIGAYAEQLKQTADSASFLWNNAQSTFTDFAAAGPVAGTLATNIVMTNTGVSKAAYYIVTLAAVQYTLSVWVKSNTGVSQNFRMGNASAPGADKTATTTWTQFSETFTPGAGSILVGILNDAAHDALDVLVYGFQLELGASASAYPTAIGDLQLGVELFPPTKVPTWDATGLTFGASKIAHGILGVPITFSHVTLYGVFKKTGADSPDFFEPILTTGSETTPAYSIVMESRDSLNSGTSANSVGPCFGFGPNPNIVNANGVKIDDGNWHVFVGTYDGTNIKVYIDGTQCAQKAAVISAKTVHRFYTGCFEGVTSATDYFPGIISQLALYSESHTATVIRSNTDILRANAAFKGIQTPRPTTFIGVEGDSIPAGLGLTQAQRWSWLALQAITPTVQQWNGSVGGSTVATVRARMPVFNQILENPALTKKILVLELGANDMSGSTSAATFLADYKQLCIDERAAGWTKIFVTFVLPRGDIPAFNAKKDAANAGFLSDPDWTNGVAADGVAQFDATILANTAPSDPTLFQADLVHPTALANSAHLEPSIQTLLSSFLP